MKSDHVSQVRAGRCADLQTHRPHLRMLGWELVQSANLLTSITTGRVESDFIELR